MKKICFFYIVFLIVISQANAFGENLIKKQVRKIWGIYLNKEAKDGEFKDINGKSYKLSDFKGKVIFLNFWGLWCPACRRQLPSIQNLYKKYKNNKNLVLIAIEIEGNPSSLKAFKEKTNYDIPFFCDEKENLAIEYKIMAIPTTFIIDKNFKIIAKFIGARNWDKEEFNSLLELLLK